MLRFRRNRSQQRLGKSQAKQTRRRSLQLEPLEGRRLMAVWRNAVDSLDIDHDQFVVPLDALHVINELNSIGPHALPITKDPAALSLDSNGDQFVSPIDALLVINYLNFGVGQQRRLQEGTTLVKSTDVTIGLGQTVGSRTYRVQLDATFDTSDTTAAVEDLLAVYLVDPGNPTTTLLDRGAPGTALFTLAETHAEYTPGKVRWDGSVLEIDLTEFNQRETGLLKFQLLSSDSDSTSRVTIVPLSNEVDPAGVASPAFPSFDAAVGAGGALNLASLSPAADVDVDVSNVRYHEESGTYAADLSV